MINLDATTRLLEVVLAGAVTTNQLPIVVNYVDVLTSDQSLSAIGQNGTVTNSAVAVTALAAPAAGHTRTIKFMTVHNADTVTAIVTVQVNDNSTLRKIVKATLLTGETLQHSENGWTIYPPSGGTVTDASLTTSDVTTNDVTSVKHGFAPKSAADATKFLNSAATPAYAQVKDSDLSTSDITTNDVTSTKHGLAPKSAADATKFLNSAATPAYAQVKDSDLSTSDITTNDVTTAKHGLAPKASTDHGVLRRSGSDVSFSAVELAQAAAVTGVLPVANGGSGVATEDVVIATNANGTLNVSSATITTVTFATEELDADTMHDTGSNTGRLTAIVAGTYLISATLQWSVQAPGTASLFLTRIKRNSDSKIVARCFYPPITSMNVNGLGQGAVGICTLAANDYVICEAYQDSSGTLTLDLANCRFGMTRIGA